MDMWNRRVGENGYTDLDWTSDACTGVDDSPFGWDCKSDCLETLLIFEMSRGVVS
jgi:hypothetical protein